MKYHEFIQNKKIKYKSSGFDIDIKYLNKNLFIWQKHIVKWALKKGKSALFLNTGMGKTICQLEWSNQIYNKEKKPILIVAPLAVSYQTKNEGKKFGIKINICESQDDIVNGINITNYEKLHKFNPSKFIAICIDESSIMKSFSGKIRNQLIDMFYKTPYRLACTATPSPNDYEELGNHSEFLGIMSRSEMLSTFFINDTGDTGKWRLKGHVQNNVFWEWMCSWSIMMTKPSDLGYTDKDYILPELRYHEHIIKTKVKPKYGFFIKEVKGMNERRKVRKETLEIRCNKAIDLINNTDDKWLIWCELNDESDLLSKKIENAVEVAGKHDNDLKRKRLLDFADGKIQRLVSKPKIAGFGMNWQVCNKAVFVGLNDSWESLYQAIRRIWRFGQNKPVDVHIIIEEREGSVLKNIKEKEKKFNIMIQNTVKHTKEISKKEIKSTIKEYVSYNPDIKMELPKWLLNN